MESLIGEWTGKIVCVSLRLGGGTEVVHKSAALEGKLVQVGETGVMLDLPKGNKFFPISGLTFVPISAVLHIRLLEGQ
ncbi:MAG: hypothetical protein ACKVP0_07920 [Pirellulaceae bacterium]